MLGAIEEVGWGRCEKALAPPDSLLDWLVQHAVLPADERVRDAALRNGDTRSKREALVDRNPSIVEEARQSLDRWRERRTPGATPPRAWYVLEGASFPDAYIATHNAIVVIEAKRKESGPTVRTTWMTGRHQMLRHLDAAWENRGRRAVVGLFVVEGDGNGTAVKVPSKWYEFAKTTVSAGALRESLPHRTEPERAEIAACLIGVTTWQTVCAKLGVPYQSLPDKARDCPEEDLHPLVG